MLMLLRIQESSNSISYNKWVAIFFFFFLSDCVGFFVLRLWLIAPPRTRSSRPTSVIFPLAQSTWNLKSTHFLGPGELLLTCWTCSQQFQPKWIQKWWRWVCSSYRSLASHLFIPQHLGSRNISSLHCKFSLFLSSALPALAFSMCVYILGS